MVRRLAQRCTVPRTKHRKPNDLRKGGKIMKVKFENPIANVLSGNLLVDVVSTSDNGGFDADQGGSED